MCTVAGPVFAIQGQRLYTHLDGQLFPKIILKSMEVMILQRIANYVGTVSMAILKAQKPLIYFQEQPLARSHPLTHN